MPYIDRNEAGHITGIYACQQHEGQEFVELAELYVPPPTKAQRIAQILATQGEGKDRTTLQLAIQLAELTATVQAPAYGMTPAQAIAYAYSKNATYRRSKDAEAAIRGVELEP